MDVAVCTLQGSHARIRAGPAARVGWYHPGMVRSFAGLSLLLLLAGCLDLNPVFVQPQYVPSTGEVEDTTTAPPTTDGPTTTGESGDTHDIDTASSAPPGVCGDGVVDMDEDCDDMNADDADACQSDCSASRCGDGALWLGVEECDDGNQVDTDECVSGCKDPFCGDGKVHKDFETCDDANDMDADGCPNNCQLPVCGNEVIEGPEECDDGNQAGDDGCEADCTETARLVFVTSVAFTGDMDGIKGANDRCEMLASQAGLPKAPYRAWLSDANAAPVTTMNKSPFKYVRVDGVKVAEDWADLTDGTLLAPIDVSEKNGPPPMIADPAPCPGYNVHTNTTAMGTAASGNHCDNWTSTAATSSWGGSFGSTDPGWSAVCTGEIKSCQFKAPIYCVQQ